MVLPAAIFIEAVILHQLGGQGLPARTSWTVSGWFAQLPRFGLARSARTIVTDDDDHPAGSPCGGRAGRGGWADFGRSIAVPQKAQMPWSPCMAIEAPQEGQ